MKTPSSYELKRLKLIAGLSRGNSVLDIGYADFPNPYINSPDLTGYDIQLNDASLNYSELIQDKVENIISHFPERRFDTIICGELIEHLFNPYGFLQDIQSLLRPDGILLLSTPNPISLNTIFFEFIQSHSKYYCNDHTFYLLPRWVERMLDLSGYCLVKKIPVGINVCNKPVSVPVALSYQVIYLAKMKTSG